MVQTHPNRDPGDEHDEDAARAGMAAHKMRRLIRLGFCEAEAFVLAQQDIDVRAVARLIDQGCPPHTAARIVL